MGEDSGDGVGVDGKGVGGRWKSGREERGEGVGRVVVGKNPLQGGGQAIFPTSWHPIESVVPEVIDSSWAASMSLPPQLLCALPKYVKGYPARSDS